MKDHLFIISATLFLIVILVGIPMCIEINMLKDELDAKQAEIYRLENEAERYKMIGDEYEELFMTCIEGW